MGPKAPKSWIRHATAQFVTVSSSLESPASPTTTPSRLISLGHPSHKKDAAPDANRQTALVY